jgi:hypothetical protein
VLRRIFGPERDEVTGGWRKLHQEKLHNFYCSPDIIRAMGGACSMHGEMRNAFKIMVGKPEGKRPLGKPKHRWEDVIKMDLREIGFGTVDWIHLAQDKDWWQMLVNTTMNFWVP